MNVAGWNPADIRVIEALYWLGSAPSLLAEVLIVIWALRMLRDRPRPAWLVLAASGLHFFAVFGLRTVFAAVWHILSTLGIDLGGAVTFLLMSMSLGLSIAMWTLMLLATFRGDDELHDISSDEATR